MKPVKNRLSVHRPISLPVFTGQPIRAGASLGLLFVLACGGKMDEGVNLSPRTTGATYDASGTGAGPEAGGHDPVVGSYDGDAASPHFETGPGQTHVGPDGGSDLPSSAKVDILFVVDNSAGMKPKIDKTARSAETLVGRLTRPRCLDATGRPNGVAVDESGTCAVGEREFAPVKDIHVGVLTTSLGPRLSDAVGHVGQVCDPSSTIMVQGKEYSRHQDDKGQLVNRAKEKGISFSSMVPSGYLAFAKANGEAGSTGSAEAFAADVRAHVGSIDPYGCGIESPLETFYRFLNQPDPYEALVAVQDRASWSGIDRTILEQRRRFLRPDSLVIVVQVSDESDSEIDVRAFGGQGHMFLNSAWAPVRGSSACETDPNSASCMSCAFPAASGDPACRAENMRYTLMSDWGFDVNLRHVQMKRKYGLDVQYPVQRYVRGLSDARVPNRQGEYPPAQGYYVGNAECQNPLFAAEVPDGTGLSDSELMDASCHARAGSRTPEQVLFLHVGGVPWQLLADDPAASRPELRTSHDANSWRRILGNDPTRHDTSGIDPHMIESQAPRAGLPGPADSASDPIHGRDWYTTTKSHWAGDLQFACVFDLDQPLDCSGLDSATQSQCHCPSTEKVPSSEVPPVCDPAKPTRQVKSGAAPTTRQLMVARGLGDRGLVASVCPLPAAAGQAYDPAMTMLLARARAALPK